MESIFVAEEIIDNLENNTVKEDVAISLEQANLLLDAAQAQLKLASSPAEREQQEQRIQVAAKALVEFQSTRMLHRATELNSAILKIVKEFNSERNHYAKMSAR
jgi:hypothetical protein